jgi:hypothetical protein
MDDHIVQVRSQKYIKDFQNIFHFIVLNSQIWLKQLMDDRQLGYIEKILFKNLIKFFRVYRWVPIWSERVQFVRAQDLLRSSAPELFNVVCGLLVGVSSLANSILKLAAAAAALSLSSSSCSQ